MTDNGETPRLLTDDEINKIINTVLYPFRLADAYRSIAKAFRDMLKGGFRKVKE